MLVDEHPAVTTGVEQLIAGEPGLDVAGVAPDARAAVLMASDLRPDVAVVDLHLPDRNGLLLTHQLVHDELVGSAVVYTAFLDDATRLGALLAGASGAVSKGERGSDLLDDIRAAARGRTWIPLISLPTRIASLHKLDPADLPIAGMLVHGTAPDQIAHVMRISEEELAGRRLAMLRALTRR
jgi:DNA-binding NarL/FixJ family response regulator